MTARQAIVATLRGGRQTEAYIERIVCGVWGFIPEEFDVAVDSMIAAGQLTATVHCYDDITVASLELSEGV